MFDINTWTVAVTAEISIPKLLSSNMISVIGFCYVRQDRCISKDNV